MSSMRPRSGNRTSTSISTVACASSNHRLRQAWRQNLPTRTSPPPIRRESRPAIQPLETREYEAALNLFRANKLKEAAAAFEAFARAHPDSTLTASAYYWLGNAHYALRDCKKAIDAQRVVASKWPTNAKAPDALLNVATCQQELADAKGAKGTLETLVAKYPDSTPLLTARQRLKK
jgi:tol-pal system protein YbgF